MALDKNCTKLPYLIGRAAAYYERYAGKRFRYPASFTKLFTEPEGAYLAWHRYAEQDSDYMEVSALLADKHPLHLLPIQVADAYVGYHHQKAAFDDVEPQQERQRIGRRIAELRKERHITQIQLAAMCGLQQAHVARIEAGKHSVGIDTLTSIARALGCQVDFITK